MGRKSKLSPEQWAEVDRKLAAGDGVRALAGEYGVSPATISKRGVAKQSKRVQEVAQKVAEAQTALAELPVPQQYTAMSLAEKFRNMGVSVLSAAELGAQTGHRLHALANSEVGKVDDAEPLSKESIESLKGVSALTKLANEALAPALNLLASNKDRLKAGEGDEPPDTPKGVLVVPGLIADTQAWSQQTQAAAVKPAG